MADQTHNSAENPAELIARLAREGRVAQRVLGLMGAPAKVARPLKPEELKFLPESAANYVGDAMEYYRYVPGAKRHGLDHSDLEQVEGFQNEETGELETGFHPGHIEHTEDPGNEDKS